METHETVVRKVECKHKLSLIRKLVDHPPIWILQWEIKLLATICYDLKSRFEIYMGFFKHRNLTMNECFFN